MNNINAVIEKYKTNEKKEYVEIIYNNFKGFLYQYVLYLKFGILPKSYNYSLSILSKIVQSTKYYKIFVDWDKEEIFNELFILLLKFIKQNPNSNNIQYIYNQFKYEIKSWILSLQKDFLYHEERFLSYIDQNKEFNEVKNIPNFCLDSSYELTNDQRYILYLYYNNKLNLKEISAILQTDVSIISKIKQEAEKKLEIIK